MSWVENFLKINEKGEGVRGGRVSVRDLRVDTLKCSISELILPA